MPGKNQPKPVLVLHTVNDAAELLNFSTRTVRRYIAEGLLPAYRVGRGIRISQADIDALLKPIATAGRPPARAS
jgi:excisionase family DNA binding protein